MDKKELLLELLSQFSQEEIKELLSAKQEENTDGVFTINKDKKRRRGKGKRKRGNNNNKENKDSNFVNKFDEMMGTIALSSDERKELEEASKADQNATVNPFRGKRAKAKKITIKCTECHKDFEVYPSSVYNKDRWRCNTCISGR